MKKFIVSLLVVFASGVALGSDAPANNTITPICHGDAILGQWKWHKYIYDGQEFPPSNPNLNLIFEFMEGGRNRLYWDRTGERGFCERYGNYIFNQCQLIDQVTWVNPDNALGCGADPDMKEGRQTMTRAEVRGDEFYLYLSLGGKPFIYIWKKLP